MNNPEFIMLIQSINTIFQMMPERYLIMDQAQKIDAVFLMTCKSLVKLESVKTTPQFTSKRLLSRYLI